MTNVVATTTTTTHRNTNSCRSSNGSSDNMKDTAGNSQGIGRPKKRRPQTSSTRSKRAAAETMPSFQNQTETGLKVSLPVIIDMNRKLFVRTEILAPVDIPFLVACCCVLVDMCAEMRSGTASYRHTQDQRDQRKKKRGHDQ